MKKNTITYLAIFISLACVGAMAGLFLTSRPELAEQVLPKPIAKKITQTSPKQQLESKLTKALGKTLGKPSKNDEIAQKTLACMEKKLRDDNGVYYGVVRCNQNGTCENYDSNRATHPTIWARAKLLQKYPSQENLDKLLADANTLAEHVQSIQNIFWNAKLVMQMQPMINSLAQHGVITNQQKNLLTANLWHHRNVYYYQKIPSEYEEITPEEAIHINPNILRQELESPDYQGNFVLDNPRFFYLDYLPSEYIARYQLTGDQQELKKANFFFSQALELIKQKKQETARKSLCMLGEASLDFYDLTEDKTYLEVAEVLWSYRDLSPEAMTQSFLRDKAACAYFTRHLGQLLNQAKYQQYADRYLQDILANHLNQNSSQWGEDYCFENITTKFQNVPTKDKRTYLNALIVVLLLES